MYVKMEYRHEKSRYFRLDQVTELEENRDYQTQTKLFPICRGICLTKQRQNLPKLSIRRIILSRRITRKKTSTNFNLS